jgi:pSer/pThr/pTyr-binding forkhead associated (FHA) protein
MEAQETNPIPLRLSVLGANGEVVLESEFAKEKIVLGRILSADLRIDDPRVSRIHALIEVRGENLILTDLASSHGTFVNGKKVVESKLKLGDTVRVGFVEVKIEKGTGQPNVSQGNFEGKPVFEGDETLLDIDRSMLESAERRGPDRRKKDAFPDERRLDQRRTGDRRIEQRSHTDRRAPADPDAPAKLPEGVKEDRRKQPDRRAKEETDRRIGERRRADRRVFDITSLERRIEERRVRRGDDDLLPEELEKAFAPPDHAQELEVTVLWGEHILDVSNYVDPIVLTVGEDAKNHYIIPSVGIPEEFPLVSIEDDGTAHLSFTEEMKGTIRCRDKMYSVEELTKEKFVKKSGNQFIVALRRDDFAKLAIGTINFFILYVKPAPRILPPPMFDRDVLLMRTFIGSALLLILFFVSVSFVPKPTPVTIDMVPERFAKIVIKKRPKIPQALASKDQSKEGGSVMGEGGRARGEEGKAGKKELPQEKPMAQVINPKVNGEIVKKEPGTPKTVSQAKPRERKVVDANTAKSVGLLKAFSKSGIKSDLKSLTDGQGEGGGFDEFGKAVQGLRGRTLEEGGGAGGKGLKGVGVGGGGTTIGIDGPSTKGFGRGWSGDGIGEGISGPGRLGIKGEHAISIASENIQVLSGLPKDVINAVVQKHRSEIRACYDAALRRNPNLRGKIVIAFTIQPNGIVSSSSVKESTLGDRGLGGCITDRVKSWAFPQPEAPVVTEVSAYPFYLVPAN